MPLYKFGPNDILYNTIETHPKCEFYMYEQEIYYNNTPELTGVIDRYVGGAPPGHVNLYELNPDRDPVVHTVNYSVTSEGIVDKAGNESLIYPFITKDGSLTDFRTITLVDRGGDTFEDEFYTTDYGAILTGSYPLSATISREFFPLNHVAKNIKKVNQGIVPDGGPMTRTQVLDTHLTFDFKQGSRINALSSTLDSYTHISPHYAYSSSLNNWFKAQQKIGLISIPSIFYGSSIKKGSVNLKFYITGGMAGELRDENHNGELIQVNDPTDGEGSGSVAGVVLYNEGFILLTGSWDLDTSHKEYYEGSTATPKWIHFGSSISGSITTISSSYSLAFSGTNPVQTITMFAHAQKGHLNFSNNPTYVQFGQTVTPYSSSTKWREQPELKIKNTVSASYLDDSTGSFKKQTYISRVALYDDDRNLIGIAKLANPVKKTEERDFTFKLKLDY